MKASDMRLLTEVELKNKETELRHELFNLRFQLAKGELSNNRRVKAVKKDIARILGVITEKEEATRVAGNK